MLPPPGPPPYALFDRGSIHERVQCWLGDDSGVKTWDNWADACCAATIVSEQLGRVVRPACYDGSANKLRDEVPTRMSTRDAVALVEGFRDNL